MRVGRGECLSEGGTGMSGEGRSKSIIDLESFLNFVFNLLLCFFSFLMMMSEDGSGFMVEMTLMVLIGQEE